MELTSLTMKVLFLFLPGIISCILISSLTETQYSSSFHFVVRAFVLGCLSYLMLVIIYSLINIVFSPSTILEVKFIKSINSNQTEIDFIEIIYVSICSVFLSFIVSKFLNKAYLHRFANIIKVSNATGHRDVWNKLLSKDEVEWILIRDKSKNLMYEGKLDQYSAEHNNGELFLKDVIVYNDNTGEKYYDLKGLYLAFNEEDMVIEIRQFSERSNNGRPDKKGFFFRKKKQSN